MCVCVVFFAFFCCCRCALFAKKSITINYIQTHFLLHRVRRLQGDQSFVARCLRGGGWSILFCWHFFVAKIKALVNREKAKGLHRDGPTTIVRSSVAVLKKGSYANCVAVFSTTEMRLRRALGNKQKGKWNWTRWKLSFILLLLITWLHPAYGWLCFMRFIICFELLISLMVW